MVEWKKLGDVCKDVIVPMRDRPKVFDGTTPWCRIEDIEGMYFNKSLSGLMVSDSVIKQMNLKVFPTGTVICSCSATLGVCAINTQPLITNQTFIGLVCSNQVNNRYLYYYMLTRKKELFSLSTTGTIPYVSRDKFEKMIIPIPSISEQERIVSILDTFTSSIDNLKQQIAQRRKQYEYYRDQLLDLEGKEGVEMKYLLDVLAQPVTDGPHETPSFYEDGIPFISADAIVDNKINFSRKRGYISEEYDLLCQKKYKPQLNDIYLVKSGSTTGKVAIVKTDERFNIWSPLAAIRVNQRNHPYFVYYMLQTKKVQDQVKLKSSQGSQPNLSMRVLEKFIIPVPPLSEQQRIVSILDTFEASIQNLEAQLAQREKQYEYYRNKLLTFE